LDVVSEDDLPNMLHRSMSIPWDLGWVLLHSKEHDLVETTVDVYWCGWGLFVAVGGVLGGAREVTSWRSRSRSASISTSQRCSWASSVARGFIRVFSVASAILYDLR
jgi:hypothetical protein